MGAWVVTAAESGQKLGAFLKDKLGDGVSARRIKQAIEQNACQINGRIERFATTPVGKGDRVTFKDVVNSDGGRVVVLYQDDQLLACDKPAGVSSEDPALPPRPNLILLHRLDKDTSGVLLWAKTEAAADAMRALFKKRQIVKTYHALVDGIPKEVSGHIENRLGKLSQYQGQSLWGVTADGMTAITDWRLEKPLVKAALVVCNPTTGRTHQIRVHMSGLGHPILGDRQYGRRFLCDYRPARCLLHASKVEFAHPMTSKRVSVAAPLPADFNEALAQLGAS